MEGLRKVLLPPCLLHAKPLLLCGIELVHYINWFTDKNEQ